MSFSKFSALAGVLSLASTVAAHGHVTGINVDGKFIGGFDLSYAYAPTIKDSIGWSTTALDNGFVEPNKFGTSDIACHLNGKPGALFATVAAGSKVEVVWDTWPESHHGPVCDYLAPFANSAADLKFFKFAESGLLDGSASPGKWASDTLIANGNKWTVTIPSDIAPGKYVWRHEIIALHGAGSPNGAQNYPQCLNLEITGSGTVKPAGIPATSFYKTTDPGILISIYTALASYIIPGPAMYSGGAASAPQPSSPSTPVKTPVSSSTPRPTAAPTLPPYNNTTMPSPTSSKAKSACKPKPTSVSPISKPTGAAPTPAAAGGSSSGESAAPIVTVVPTPANPSNGGSSPAPAPTPTTPKGPADAGLPSGTKLSSVLKWLSSFYAKYGDGGFTSGSALRRRHAREMNF